MKTNEHSGAYRVSASWSRQSLPSLVLRVRRGEGALQSGHTHKLPPASSGPHPVGLIAGLKRALFRRLPPGRRGASRCGTSPGGAARGWCGHQGDRSARGALRGARGGWSTLLMLSDSPGSGHQTLLLPGFSAPLQPL